MSESMIERVARAICTGMGFPEDEIVGAAPFVRWVEGDHLKVQHAREGGPRWKAHWEPLARHLIEAMREPTKEMVEAAWRSGSGEFETPPPVDVAYRAMIDAALSEKP